MVSRDRFRSFTGKNLPYSLMEGYPKITATLEGVTAQEKYLIKASDAEAFYNESFPAPTRVNNTIDLKAPRTMPGAPLLYTSQLSFEPLNNDRPGDPLGNDTGAPSDTYEDLYVVTIDYESKDANSFDHFRRSGAEFISVPSEKTKLKDEDVQGFGKSGSTSMFVAEPNRNLQASYLVVQPTVEHSLRWKIIVEPDFVSMDAKLGMVNSDWADILGQPAPETCLFIGYTAQKLHLWQEQDIDAWSVELHFTQKQVTEKADNGDALYYGWNHVYSPKHGKWMRLLRTGGLDEEEDDPRDYYASFEVQKALSQWPGVVYLPPEPEVLFLNKPSNAKLAIDQLL